MMLCRRSPWFYMCRYSDHENTPQNPPKYRHCISLTCELHPIFPGHVQWFSLQWAILHLCCNDHGSREGRWQPSTVVSAVSEDKLRNRQTVCKQRLQGESQSDGERGERWARQRQIKGWLTCLLCVKSSFSADMIKKRLFIHIFTYLGDVSYYYSANRSCRKVLMNCELSVKCESSWKEKKRKEKILQDTHVIIWIHRRGRWCWSLDRCLQRTETRTEVSRSATGFCEVWSEPWPHWPPAVTHVVAVQHIHYNVFLPQGTKEIFSRLMKKQETSPWLKLLILSAP